MRNLLYISFLFFALKAPAQIIEVNSYTPCQVLVIHEEAAKESDYGWWSVWCEKKAANQTKTTPCLFTLRPNERYLIVAFDAENDISDGVVMKGIMLEKKESRRYDLRVNDFVEWHNLACN
ncbi:MAG: hypothetical protein ACFB0B_20390 [Thermonemataceae bacterium]